MKTPISSAALTGDAMSKASVLTQPSTPSAAVTGEFVTMAGERYYAIRNVDKIPPFFISVVSDSDHWLFVASNGGLAAGRVSPDTSLFPYITVDKIYESTPHTGSKTLLRVELEGQHDDWEPFNAEHDNRFNINRNLYKNSLGNKLLFEEINHDLQLVFRYTWACSDRYGFVRQCEIENFGAGSCSIELLDGLQNLLPAGTPRYAQTNTSYLVDAYKWNELDEHTGLALFTLFSGITDRAEPSESLKATTVFSLGLDKPKILLSSQQINRFRDSAEVSQENHKRGIRGAFMVNASLKLAPKTATRWQLVANIEQSQTQSVNLQHQLANPQALEAAIEQSLQQSSDALARIMAAGDGFQVTAEETVAVHHYANVQYNIMRGGIFDNQYQVDAQDFGATIRAFNGAVYQQHQTLLEALPPQTHFNQLLSMIIEQGDPQLERLTYEYLPITFGRRHGDPSRPWNEFEIKLKDETGDPLLAYQGNWRDIFQNWEALMFSYPEFIENVIAKFVNASTADGYNPYRITKEGIDWEIEEPDDPWSYIGYWGDHQIIYLQKLLELSQQFHPNRLDQLLRRPIFSYANVPYKIKPFDALLENAKSTVVFDHELAQRIEQRVASLGADGKLLADASGQVYLVNLLEKLLVPLLSKLGNLVIDGGIWLNTQRPEWNDANNALVGQGLSMVTLYYMRRYVRLLQQLLTTQLTNGHSDEINLSTEVSQWLVDTAGALNSARVHLSNGPIAETLRYAILAELGQASGQYRQVIYQQESFSGTRTHRIRDITALLNDALAAIDHSIQSNLAPDGLYHAYNLLELRPDAISVDRLYAMLEGQVAALSSGAIAPVEAVAVLERLFKSNLYRADQKTFLLYPDRQLPSFLEKNRLPTHQVEALPVLMKMLAQGEHRIIEQDANHCYRFNAELRNIFDLNAQLDALTEEYGDSLEQARAPLQALYEQVFNHKAFTGRSGGMFGFEGLGSIYWHMVSKLLLATQENFFIAREQAGQNGSKTQHAISHRLGELYYRIRDGIGFNKTPAEYGAFPTDPYSHTPSHIGAQQPGMTGQVKEEIITRFAELGIRVHGGLVLFDPGLLRPCEFVSEPTLFRFLDVDRQWQQLAVPAAGLAFTWCQVPLVYRLDNQTSARLEVTWDDGTQQILPALTLPLEMANELFKRSGRIRRIDLVVGDRQLFSTAPAPSDGSI
ncbi:hypothetical protein [Reinekea sp.]|uniref:hypothetical protein n=1 Tax=Reinekea sp. TaxID=1970455 RepID=UPI00257F5149|nr:hypothetical protein [Reinekea sp.]